LFGGALVFVAVIGKAGGSLLTDAGDFFLRGGEGLDRVAGAGVEILGPLDCFAGVRQAGYQAPFGLRRLPIDLCLLSPAVLCRPPESGFLSI
jgi:hypothetical protein